MTYTNFEKQILEQISKSLSKSRDQWLFYTDCYRGTPPLGYTMVAHLPYLPPRLPQDRVGVIPRVVLETFPVWIITPKRENWTNLILVSATKKSLI